MRHTSSVVWSILEAGWSTKGVSAMFPVLNNQDGRLEAGSVGTLDRSAGRAQRQRSHRYWHCRRKTKPAGGIQPTHVGRHGRPSSCLSRAPMFVRHDLTSRARSARRGTAAPQYQTPDTASLLHAAGPQVRLLASAGIPCLGPPPAVRWRSASGSLETKLAKLRAPLRVEDGRDAGTVTRVSGRFISIDCCVQPKLRDAVCGRGSMCEGGRRRGSTSSLASID